MIKIRLRTSDGETFETDTQVVKCSGLIMTLLKDSGEEVEENALVLLPCVTSTALRRVLTWAQFHKDDDEGKDKRTISSWDARFLEVDKDTLFQLVLAADYLKIQDLLDLTCDVVSTMVHGKTPEQMRKFFNINIDFKPAEWE
nr:S-phase kinase-associated protein 1-like [Drosophila takahashii]